MSKMGSKMGSVWMLLANFLRFVFEASKKVPPMNPVSTDPYVPGLPRAKKNWFTSTKNQS